MAQQKPVNTTLPPLEEIVQKMIDANESDEDIATVIQHYKGGPNTGVPPTKLEGQPTDFWGGVKKSFTSGEVHNAMDEGVGGWLKGAITDLPGSIIGGLKSVGNLIAHPVDTISNLPSDISNMASGMWNTTKQAGSNPSAFGEMMGQIGGQPLVTAGITKGAPMLRNPIGRGIEMIGDTMEQHQPISGMIPRMVEPRIARTIERKIGGKVSEFGNRIQKPKVVQGEIVSPPEPAFQEGQFREVPPEGPPQLNRSDTIYPPKTSTITDKGRLLEDNKPLGLPSSDTSFYGQLPIEINQNRMLPKFGGSTVNPMITKSMEAPIHPLDELINSLKLDSGGITTIDDSNNITSNFQKRQVPDTLQKPSESPVAGPVPGPPNDIEAMIAQLQDSVGPKFDQPRPIPETPLEANPAEIHTNKSKIKSADTIVHTGPSDISDMKVWHNIGKSRYKPEFASDLDKVKFLAGQTAPSKNLTKYIKFITDKTGMNESEALQSAKEFRLHAKELMDGKKPGVIQIPSIGGK